MSVPALRFKEFSSEWDFNSLGDIVKIKSGFGFKASEYCTSGVKLLQIENVGYGIANWNNNCYLPIEYLDKYPELYLKENDIVIALNRPVTNNQLKIVKLKKHDSPSILYQRVGKLLFINKLVQIDYIYQVFTTYVKDFALKQSIGSDQPFISITSLYKFKIPLPSLPEQTKIANFLTAVDEKISLLTQKADLLSQYKKGVMQQIFKQELRFKDDDGKEFPEWEDKRICDIADLTSSKRVYLSDYVSEGIPFYRGKEISELKRNETPKDILYITTKAYNAFKASYGVPQVDDILITAVGTLGNVYRIKDDSEFYFKDGNLIWLRDIKILSAFLEILFETNNEAIQKSSIGSSQRALTIVELKKLKFSVPSLPEQTKIANFLTAIDEKITTNQTQLNAVKQYKQGLLQQMFV
jgi:type I restriction enzyme S subunit